MISVLLNNKETVHLAMSGSFLVKSLAEFRRRCGEKSLIVFDRDMCVGENTSRPANVRVVRNNGQ